ncbi:putative T7SS-secreted protein [Streptomyces sp. NPDC091292]|uniref:putative T7SS-secreted protein n=1 Tax=Streptomyces sp. NPDC091292 TaxID=3365991 RepID=UPI00380891E9
MSRPKEWEPLHDGDPIPGDPYEVARLGKELRGMADEIDKQARNIRALSSVEGWDSDAGRAFHEIADGASGRLKRSYERYDEASKALGTRVVDGESREYAGELNRAQQIADKALSDFRVAEGDHKTAVGGLDEYRGTAPSKDDITDRTRLAKNRDAAMDTIRQCHSEIRRAKDIRDDAASAAAKHIKNVIHHDGVRDPGGFMNMLADWADGLATLSSILSVLAVICAFVPPLTALAPILAVAAVLVSALALAGHAYDMTARGGKLDLLKLGLDVLGVIPGFGAIKGFSALKGLKGLSKLRGIRFSGSKAIAGVGEKFFNGIAVKGTNYILGKIGKAPIPGREITAYIKGAGFASALHKIFTGRTGASTGDPGDPAPQPKFTPRPSPQPSPTPFHAALAA